MRIATCSCGQLKVTCAGEPVRISICYCLACQKRSGSVFAVQARFPADQVQIEGRSHAYVRTGDEGGRATFRFCPTCGATVYYEIEAMPDVIAVAVGAFADPTFPAPTVSVYSVRRHPWAAMPELHAEEQY
ncbi:MAG TPA: GFA family protein [Kofleriaceae bacterium]|nr:GFA family protein [Kofleriaceae bacterium]